ncbi:TorF family putative porin [Synoicihabitans lomoniglobus]|uniref:TorF family putative porin n=1 Tax=Synoicihabitans lomoniglobus TaxID=2909285 RepID=A0AAE9ZTP2_9BACT|nr:TorF family putative porin [Opitutaceae bacterium LMO-M01]WED63912.1 TorF family putative porin [Opitutaceae bacterium LMO-M01]
MKKTAALLLAAALTGGSLSAQEESSYSISLDFPFVSDYVFRGIKLASDSIQPSIEFASGDFYAGMWTSQPVTGSIANEFDFYIGYGAALSDTWSLDFGATYYYYPETPSGDESFEPYVGLSGDLGGGLSASGYFYYDTELETSTMQGGLGYSAELSDSSTFDLAMDLGFVVASGGTDYTYYGLSGTFNYTLNDVASSYFGLVYADSDLAGEDSHFYVITGISMGF